MLTLLDLKIDLYYLKKKGEWSLSCRTKVRPVPKGCVRLGWILYHKIIMDSLIPKQAIN